MFKRVRIYAKHKTEAKAKEHAAFIKSQNETKILATGYEYDSKLGHRSWFEVKEWQDNEN